MNWGGNKAKESIFGGSCLLSLCILFLLYLQYLLCHREVEGIVENVERALSKAALNGIFHWKIKKQHAINAECS